ncbi:sensor histidine kinase [Halanaerobaculum tunisiense]
MITDKLYLGKKFYVQVILITILSYVGFYFICQNDLIFNLNLPAYLVEVILELIVSFICWSIVGLLLLVYKYTTKLKNLFIASCFLFAGIMILNHSILVFNYEVFVYNSSSHVFAVTAIMLVAIGLYVINNNKEYNNYLLYCILFSIGSIVIIIYLMFKVWSVFPKITWVINFILKILLFINIFNNRFKVEDNKERLLLVKGFIFLLLVELLSVIQIKVFGVLYLMIHSYKVIGFSYILMSIFKQKITKGILAQQKLELKQTKVQLKNEKIKRLKSQRDEFKEQLETIYTMLQLEKVEEIKDYIKQIHNKLNNVTAKEENNELSVVLTPKKQEAEAKNIEFSAQIDAQVNKVKVTQTKVLKILFNLVDNAIEAVSTVSKAKREVKVKLVEQKNSIELIVYNSGPIIPEEMQKNIFTPGYTTKEDGSGFGLHIVENIVKKHGGQIEFYSQEDFGTEFICQFPKKY